MVIMAVVAAAIKGGTEGMVGWIDRIEMNDRALDFDFVFFCVTK